ncbi:hypothetical protein L1987_24147 [Smallanthus sonchifolius]|uniref:Uncharacterized protein n=1 Tax=Smallanthus sonchifolius TaxID=185202 RepID=A0ACB9IJK7_9ASTR|nr:hypothetical protein L1987_24147 [Smallanthus sonchifolius]
MRYVANSTTKRVYNKETRQVEEWFHIDCSNRSLPQIVIGADWAFDYDNFFKSFHLPYDISPEEAAVLYDSFLDAQNSGFLSTAVPQSSVPSTFVSDPTVASCSGTQESDSEDENVIFQDSSANPLLVDEPSNLTQDQGEIPTNLDSERPGNQDMCYQSDSTQVDVLPVPEVASIKELKAHPITNIIGNLRDGVQTRSIIDNTCLYTGIKNSVILDVCSHSCFISQVEPKNVEMALRDNNWIEAMQEELAQFDKLKVWNFVDLPKGVYPIVNQKLKDNDKLCIDRIESLKRDLNSLGLKYKEQAYHLDMAYAEIEKRNEIVTQKNKEIYDKESEVIKLHRKLENYENSFVVLDYINANADPTKRVAGIGFTVLKVNPVTGEDMIYDFDYVDEVFEDKKVEGIPKEVQLDEPKVVKNVTRDRCILTEPDEVKVDQPKISKMLQSNGFVAAGHQKKNLSTTTKQVFVQKKPVNYSVKSSDDCSLDGSSNLRKTPYIKRFKQHDKHISKSVVFQNRFKIPHVGIPKESEPEVKLSRPQRRRRNRKLKKFLEISESDYHKSNNVFLINHNVSSLKRSNCESYVSKVDDNVDCELLEGQPRRTINNTWYVDSGCSRHMTGNIRLLEDVINFDGGYVAFAGNKGGYITGQGTLKNDKVKFEKVNYVEQLEHNLLSVSQVCDKKFSFPFNDSECYILKQGFVIPEALRRNDTYVLDMSVATTTDSIPTCLLSKESASDSILWHWKLAHINYRKMNYLVKNDLVFWCSENEIFMGHMYLNKMELLNERTGLWLKRHVQCLQIVEEWFHIDCSNRSLPQIAFGPDWAFDYDNFFKSFHLPYDISPEEAAVLYDSFQDAQNSGFLPTAFPQSSVPSTFVSDPTVAYCSGTQESDSEDENVIFQDSSTDPLLVDELSNLKQDQGEIPTNLDSEIPVNQDLSYQSDSTQVDVLLVPEVASIKELKAHPITNIIGNLRDGVQTRSIIDNTCLYTEAMQEELAQFDKLKVWNLVDLPKGVYPIGTKWVFKFKKDDRGVVVRNKARLVVQGFNQQEGIDYTEVYAHVARLEAIRLFLAFASYCRSTWLFYGSFS